MAQWYVKDLSKLTGVTVQTLHHYDRIDLLKPSIRLANGYRVYSEKDLLRLQQILALKFFSFELSQIKTLLTGDANALEHFSVQAKLLDQKANTLRHASDTLNGVISDVNINKSIPWETIIQLIEVYRMTQKLEQSWVKDIFTAEELKQYATFETEVKATLTPEQKANFEKKWSLLVFEIKRNLKTDPKSEIGIQLCEQFMQWINRFYGKKYAHLRTKIFEKGYGEGKGLEETGLTPECLTWLEQAMDFYWRDRITMILAKVGKSPSSEVLTLWNEVQDEMYGDDDARKKDLLNLVLQDGALTSEAKKWLKTLTQ